MPPGRPARQPPAYQQAVTSSKLSRPQPISGAGGGGAAGQLLQVGQNPAIAPIIGPAMGMLPTNAIAHHPLRGRPSSLKLVQSGNHAIHVEPSPSEGLGRPAITPPANSTNVPSLVGHHQRRGSAGMVNTQLLQQSGMVIPKGEDYSKTRNVMRGNIITTKCQNSGGDFS